MNGHLIRGTPIAVDFWQIRKCSGAKLFFLTHFHSDHTVGLTSSWNYPIYCSKLTGELICKKFDVSKELIRPLELSTPVLVPLDSAYSETITVVAIDANHCPGAVMLLFQGYFGCMLYTGDFRYDPKMITDSYLSSLGCSIDTLYLDNTFCDPKCDFQTRTQAKRMIIELISYHPAHDIIFGMTNLGKPDLLVEVAKHFQEYIGVPQIMFEYFELIETPDVFEVDTREHNCRIRVVPFYLINQKFMNNLPKQAIAILPTALYEGLDGTPYCNQNNVFVVPYSDHSSYSELVEFIQKLHPKQIIPIVSTNVKGPFNVSLAHRADMSNFNQYLSRSPIKKYTMPNYLKTPIPSLAVNPNNCLLSTGKKKKRSFQRPSVPKGVVFESPVKSSSSKAPNENRRSEPQNSNITSVPESTTEEDRCSEPKISEEKYSNITSVPESPKTDSQDNSVECLQTPSSNNVAEEYSIVQNTITGISAIVIPTKNGNENACMEKNSDTSKESSAERVSPFENQCQRPFNISEKNDHSYCYPNLIESNCSTNKKCYKPSEVPSKTSKNTVNCRKPLQKTTDLNKIISNIELNQIDKETEKLLPETGADQLTENINNERVSDSEESIEDGCSISNNSTSTIYPVNIASVVNENIGKNNVFTKKHHLSPICQYSQDSLKNGKRAKNVVDVRVNSHVWTMSKKGDYVMSEQCVTHSQELVSDIVEQSINSVNDNTFASNFIGKHPRHRNHKPQHTELFEIIIDTFVLKQRKKIFL